MPSLTVSSRFDFRDTNGKSIHARSMNASITVDASDWEIQNYKIGTLGTQELYNVASSVPAAWDFLWVENQDLSNSIELEVVTADGGNVVVSTITLPADTGTYWLSRVSRDSAHVEGWGTTGALDTIDKIDAYNKSGSNVRVHVFFAT